MSTAQPKTLSVTGLLPCPFCGSTDLSHYHKAPTAETPKTPICIMCEACGATGPCHGETKDQQRAQWQARAEVHV